MFADYNFGFEHSKFNRGCPRLAAFAYDHKKSQAWDGLFPNWLISVV